MDPPFYAEQAPWPYVHAVVPIALYIAIRYNPRRVPAYLSLLVTILLVFVWEFFERIASYLVPVLQEPIDDSLIGDPLIGASGVLAFWLTDQYSEADSAFAETVQWYWRALVFVLAGALTVIAGLFIGPRIYGGLVIYAFIYFFLGALYGIPILSAPEGRARTLAIQNVMLWLGLTSLYALVSAPVTNPSLVLLTSWWRALWPSVVIIGVVLVLIVIKRFI